MESGDSSFLSFLFFVLRFLLVNLFFWDGHYSAGTIFEAFELFAFGAGC